MNRSYYSATIRDFLATNEAEILGSLVAKSDFPVEQAQRDAWVAEIKLLKPLLANRHGHIYFEYSIPRFGKRIDVVVLLGPVIFVLEFKVGENRFSSSAIDQVCDYALDLKNFHETSHERLIAPILIATNADSEAVRIERDLRRESLFLPIRANSLMLPSIFEDVLLDAKGADIDGNKWEGGRYSPTPTIVEAAMALYRGHSVNEISRSDAAATNLTLTTNTINQIVSDARNRGRKAVCFVTGVPGAGKTLVGLDTATQHIDDSSELYSVFLSGNGPLVAVLREALARDKVERARLRKKRVRKGAALSEVKMFIQNVHHFRDDCLVDSKRPPIEHVALFDEAQRAWNRDKTADFMRRKKHVADFDQSEPEFLISCLDRHRDWAVVVCLVGGGQEINTGEAGISEWIKSLVRSFDHWDIYVSSRLSDSEYAAGGALSLLSERENVFVRDQLHLSVSMRSFRAENVSLLVKQILDLDDDDARKTFKAVQGNYPIVLTRNLDVARDWVREKAAGTERYGLVVSSQAQRLKPYAVDVRSPIDPVHWFLNGKDDIRSSYYLEDVATEFHVQGLELDWACVAWDADFRRTGNSWEHWSFSGNKWKRIKAPERRAYLKNAYRVLLTRARQGMVIAVPRGDDRDHTRPTKFYDSTFEYLQSIGFPVIS